jgi:hypothetical protein
MDTATNAATAAENKPVYNIQVVREVVWKLI